jgi:hypothetical protein
MRVGQLTFKTVEAQAHANRQGKRKSFWSFSRADAAWLVFCYVVSFLICRFDITRHHAFEHPMATSTAVWLAVPLALVLTVLVKIKNR